jgi:hypothetical protein
MLQQMVAIPGDSRVCQAMRTLHPDAHTIGDLVTMVGAAALAQVNVGAVGNVMWTASSCSSIISDIDQLVHVVPMSGGVPWGAITA